MKKDRLLELAKYRRSNVVEKRRGGTYEVWAKKTIKESERTVRRLHRYHNISRLVRSNVINVKRISRNKRSNDNKNREKFGVKIPNSVCGALMIDTANGKKLWGEAIAKEMIALDRAIVFQYFLPRHQLHKSEYQFTPLRAAQGQIGCRRACGKCHNV